MERGARHCSQTRTAPLFHYLFKPGTAPGDLYKHLSIAVLYAAEMSYKYDKYYVTFLCHLILLYLFVYIYLFLFVN